MKEEDRVTEAKEAFNSFDTNSDNMCVY